jgi:non-homologous end joining protein Ku
MPRPIWSGTISFGLVSVSVTMYSAIDPKELRFHFLHKDDLMVALRELVEQTQKKRKKRTRKAS